MNLVQILHSLEMQKMHALDVQKIPSGSLGEEFTFPPEGIKCRLAGGKKLHSRQKENNAFWPKGKICNQANGQRMQSGLKAENAGRDTKYDC
jgi:hypothetical protein